MGNIFTTILVQPLTNGLIVFYRVLGHNLGIAILVFSLVLIFLLRPLTKPYMKSMKRIKEMEPQLAKLRKKFMPAIIIPENTMMPTKNASPFHFGTPSLIRFDIITVKINAKKRVYVDSSLSDK